jgi:hypothetical protein
LGAGGHIKILAYVEICAAWLNFALYVRLFTSLLSVIERSSRVLCNECLELTRKATGRSSTTPSSKKSHGVWVWIWLMMR